MTIDSLTRPALLTTITALALSGCGGSGGGDTTKPAAVTPASISISGHAAAASALRSRAVQAKCRTGSGETNTDDSTGRYQMSVTGGAFPCALRVQLADGSALHSVATDAGNGAATANITPLTELAVGQLTGSAPATYYASGFAATNGSALTAEAVATAGSRVTAALGSAGVDTTAVGNPVTSTLVAAGAGTANGHGQALTALDRALQTGGSSLAALGAAIVAASPTATPSNVVSLPAAQLLQAQAPNCKALRSGRYRVVFNGTIAPGIITIDAAALRGASSDGSFTLTANGPCRYRTSAGGELVVSAAGVLTGQRDEAPFRGFVLFPEQTHELAAVAGTIDFLGLDRVGSNARPQLTSLTVTIATNGEVTRLEFCESMLGNCTKLSKGDAGFPTINLAVNPAGGFLLRNTTGGFEDPFFVYTTGGGEKMYVVGSASGHIAFGTRNVARTMPTVGAVSESWNLSFVPNATEPFYTAPLPVSESKNTIASLNDTAGSYVRQAVVDFNTGVTVPETIELNVPRAGYIRRVPGSATASDGGTRTVSEWVALNLRGAGVSAVGIVGNQNLILSTTKAD